MVRWSAQHGLLGHSPADLAKGGRYEYATMPSPAAAVLLQGALALALAPTLAAQTPRVIYTASGDAAGDFLGYAIAACGDLDGDGLADVLAGAPYDDDLGIDAGTARVLGRGGRIILTLRGDSADDQFGTSVAGLGDVNRDGWRDLIVGAPGDDNRGADSGSARVFSGRDGSVLYSIDGDAAGDECGYAVGSAGDIDRDGFADFIVGLHLADAPRHDTGIARVVSGRDGHVIYDLRGDMENDHFGAFVGEVGDVNADGWPDFIITAPWADIGFLKSGSAYVFSGRDGTRLYLLWGDGNGHEFGTAFAKCGDVDGDGYADLFIAEPEHKRFGDDAGAVKLFSGRTGTLLLTLFGSAPYEYFGLTIGAGDFDGDGVPDLVVGAFLEDTGAPNGGAIYVYSGVTYARIFAAYGGSSGEQLGRAVDFVGDVDGDGLGDIVAGIPGLDLMGNDAGGVRAFCGAPAQPTTATYGVGCPPTRPFTLQFAGTPRAGQPFQIQVSNGPVTVPLAWLALATRAQTPLELTAAGMPGCTLYQPLDILLQFSVSGGAGTIPLTAPILNAACGLQVFVQALGWEPTANPLGVIASNGGRIVVAN